MTCSAPSGSAATRNRPSAAARSTGSSHSRPGGYDGAEKPVSSSHRARRRRRVEAREAALREERPGDVQRPADRLAPPDGDHLGARGESVQPLGRGRHARADDGHAARVVVRLVRVDDPRVAGELVRQGDAGMARREEDVRGRRRVQSSSKPPSTARTCSTLPPRKLSSQPHRSRSSCDVARGTPRRSAGSGCRRCAARGPGVSRRAASRAASPGNEVA